MHEICLTKGIMWKEGWEIQLWFIKGYYELYATLYWVVIKSPLVRRGNLSDFWVDATSFLQNFINENCQDLLKVWDGCHDE